MAHGRPGDAEVLVAFVLGGVFLAVWARSRTTGSSAPARYIVKVTPTTILKNGVPYCSACGRQVSLRRGVCRSCGAPTIASSMEENPEFTRQSDEEREEAIRREAIRSLAADNLRRGVQARWFRIKLQAGLARARWRHHWTRQGIEPGLFAPVVAGWRVLPDWIQAILIGLAIAIPIGAWFVLYFSGSR